MMEGGLYLDICAGVPESLVTPLLRESVCLHSQGRFEEPVRHGTSMNEYMRTRIQEPTRYEVLPLSLPVSGTSQLFKCLVS